MKENRKQQIDAILTSTSGQMVILEAKKWKVRTIWLPAGRDIGLTPDATKPIHEVRSVVIEGNEPTLEENALTITPAIGEALIALFCAKNRVDAILGDLAERFADEVVAKGEKRAKLLFWVRVIRSIGPLFWIKVRKTGFLAILFEVGRRWIGS
jgi:hypothetical protein